MTRYEGRRTWHGTEVTANGRPLDLRLDLRNHSPTGFDWGYGGSGPAQLALAILADHLADSDQALDLYQRFKWAVVAEFPRQGWILTGEEIDAALHRIRAQEAVGGRT